MLNKMGKIRHKNLGKVTTLDGTIYNAQEILFHTPSEHTINGNHFPLEIQIIHNAITKGDFGKNVIVSFLFKAKAGSYNKFIESLDFFSLPNSYTGKRLIHESISINNILLLHDDTESINMTPFSFYTYQGSLTQPPCVEKVIHYVASEPIELSTTAIQLISEALKIPDLEDKNGNIVVSDSILYNNRRTQQLNGRTIFHYDKNKYNSPLFVPFRKNEKQISTSNGHYEKQIRDSTEYFFVEGDKPSGIIGATIVSDSEALANLN